MNDHENKDEAATPAERGEQIGAALEAEAGALAAEAATPEG